jgi:hypothetical protein
MFPYRIKFKSFLKKSSILLCLLFCLLYSKSVTAQDNYEIQVYPSELVPQGNTMLELHSNYTMDGTKQTENGLFATHHIIHETIEITHGFTSWFETGFYLFNAIGSDNRTGFVGSHIRPRFSAPEAWKWPFGASLSLEFGYCNLAYSQDDYTLELRPIIDKKWGPYYASFNPVFDKSLHGLNASEGFIFSPNLKFSYDFTKKIAAGLEYYGALGALNQFYAYNQQQHQLFLAFDINLGTDWEFNCGYGYSLTPAADNAIVKMILGYRLHKKEKSSSLK